MRLISLSVAASILTACGSVDTANVVADNGTTHAALDTSQTYEIASLPSGQALDIVGVSKDNGAQLQQYTYGGGLNQQWTLTPTDNGTFAIISVNSNRALDVPAGSLANGVIVSQWDFWDGPWQRWSLVPQSDGSFEIVNANSGMCLDVINGDPTPGVRVQQWTCWGGPNQKWNMISVGSTSAAPTTTAPSAPQAITALDFEAAGNAGWNIVDYGSWLQGNKNHLQSALDSAGASVNERALVTAMAMLETTDMDPSQRDSSKDGTSSANLSILNLNLDMVQQLGYQGNDNGASLNDPANLTQAVSLLLHGIRMWGVAPTLNFQRGGRTAFNDGVSYGAADYRNVIASIYAQIAADPTLQYDGRRVEIYLDHV